MILVTGAAGKTGLAVLRALAAHDLPARALIHRPELSKLVLDAGAREVVLADLRDVPAFREALEGTDALYLILPNMFQGEYERGVQLIAASQAAGLPRLVYHSVLYPDVEAMPHHWDKYRLEQHLAASSLDYSVIQPASYMQNLFGYWRTIKQSGHYTLPYSVDAKFSPVDLGDVAAAASRVLAQDGHRGASYALCGPEILSSAQMAAQIGELLGRSVEAQEEDISAWRERARRSGLTPYALDALEAMFGYYDRHGFSGSPDMLTSLLGRPPTTFREFLERINSEGLKPSQG